ncbi:hypothetical protein HK099_003128 [Clydaea vesicula]|uniref:Uncharacterized protein n=1 Tax=Clydaea vesicula TaxID=447962 RepID=A0AAD5Y391_9FUNG|nr:hypothetical protein HK099_003128 [Clydaea vesicula]
MDYVVKKSSLKQNKVETLYIPGNYAKKIKSNFNIETFDQKLKFNLENLLSKKNEDHNLYKTGAVKIRKGYEIFQLKKKMNLDNSVVNKHSKYHCCYSDKRFKKIEEEIVKANLKHTKKEVSFCPLSEMKSPKSIENVQLSALENKEFEVFGDSDEFYSDSEIDYSDYSDDEVASIEIRMGLGLIDTSF